MGISREILGWYIPNITDETYLLSMKNIQTHSMIHNLPNLFFLMSYVSLETVEDAWSGQSYWFISSGLDGMLLQHLDLTSVRAEQGGKELLHALTTFTNFVLVGDVPRSVWPIFGGGGRGTALLYFEWRRKGFALLKMVRCCPIVC